MRARWLTAALVLVVLTVVWGVACGAEERPTGRVSPAPEINAQAVIWRAPEPPKEAQAGDVWVDPKDGAEMVYVAAGEFLMGSRDADIAALMKENPDLRAPFATDHRPQFHVRLPAYWIDECEVTVARYRTFCKEAGRKMPDAPSWGWQDDHPVGNVTWHDAAAYAAWAGKRLPTEAEWEKAARGTAGREYPWGNGWDAGRCANKSNSSTTKPVGSYPSGASSYGVLDMAGNVWEWCADWYDHNAYERYAKGELTPPAGGTTRVFRGGDWGQGHPALFRCANRVSGSPDSRANSLGFRCVRGLP